MRPIVLLLVVVVWLLVVPDCTDVLDKQVDRQSFITDLQQIHREYPNVYSAHEMEELASRLAAIVLFGAEGADKTYRQLLDEICAYSRIGASSLMHP